MLAVFRRHLDSWYARGFFLLLVASFMVWGVGDVITNLGTDTTTIATVDGRKIPVTQAQAAFQQQLQQVSQMFGGKTDPTPQIRQGVAAQTVEQLVTQTALTAEAEDMGLGVSDDALRQATFDIPAFQVNGKFDRTQFNAVLSQYNLTETSFLARQRDVLIQQQLLEAVRAGVVAPDILGKQVYAFQHETRVADMVTVPFATAASPTPPTPAQQTRWYENHKDMYSTPEYRRLKLVVLSVDTVGKDVTVTDDDLKAAYAQQQASFQQPETRSLDVFLLPDEAKAKDLAAQWLSGTDMATLTKLAGGPPVALTDAKQSDFPAPELAQAAFAAPLNAVMPPVHSPLGWQVFRVSKITPGVNKSLDDVKDQLRQQIVASKAADLIDDHASKIEDALSGGASLDDLPGDLGLAAATGTVDAQGMTTDGKPAPIPGSDGLRAAILAAAFQAKKGDPAQLTQGPAEPDGTQPYFAFTVEDITPPAVKPQDAVSAQIVTDWTKDAVRHEQETRAADILTAIKAGKSLADASGLPVTRLAPAERTAPPAGMPANMLDPLFGMVQGEPTMIETPDGFDVAVLAQINEVDPASDPIGYGTARDAMTKAVADDVQSVLTIALRDRAKPTLNQAQIAALSQTDPGN